MSRYTDFTLYWEIWGGYPDREAPFGLPKLAWFVATADRAMRCLVTSQPKDSMTVTWDAGWQQVPRALLDPLPGLLEEAGAFGGSAALLTEDTAGGDYIYVWELTGAVHDRPFRLEVQRTGPPFQWPTQTLGQRLSDTLWSLYNHQPGN